jgi:urease accessory protein
MLDRPESEDRGAAAFPAELMIWLSPVFPVGAFAYSQGLETAAERGWVKDAATLTEWLAALARYGTLRNDVILLSLVHRARDQAAIIALAELAAALQPSRERADEAAVQGAAFINAYRAAWTAGEMRPSQFPQGGPVTPPVAVGIAARAHCFPLLSTLIAYGAAFQSNLVSAAIRLGVVGQFDGQRVLAALLPVLREVCGSAITASEEDLGSASFVADLASILHETQTTRLFRS